MAVQLQLFLPKIYVEIFSYLPSDDFLNAEKVCKAWRNAVLIEHQINDYRIRIGYLTPIEWALQLSEKGSLTVLNSIRTLLTSVNKSQAVYFIYLIGRYKTEDKRYKAKDKLTYLNYVNIGINVLNTKKWTYKENFPASMAFIQYRMKLLEAREAFPPLRELVSSKEELEANLASAQSTSATEFGVLPEERRHPRSAG